MKDQDPLDACLFYIAMRKKTLVKGLFRWVHCVQYLGEGRACCAKPNMSQVETHWDIRTEIRSLAVAVMLSLTLTLCEIQ